MKIMKTRRARTMTTRSGKQTSAGGEHDEEESVLNDKTPSSTRTIAYRAVRVSHEDEERTSSFLFSLDRQRVNRQGLLGRGNLNRTSITLSKSIRSQLFSWERSKCVRRHVASNDCSTQVGVRTQAEPVAR
jgi:hypothetical protein